MKPRSNESITRSVLERMVTQVKCTLAFLYLFFATPVLAAGGDFSDCRSIPIRAVKEPQYPRVMQLVISDLPRLSSSKIAEIDQALSDGGIQFFRDPEVWSLNTGTYEVTLSSQEQADYLVWVLNVHQNSLRVKR